MSDKTAEELLHEQVKELVAKNKALEKELHQTKTSLTKAMQEVDFLECLRVCGVDKWEGYGEAQDLLYSE